MMSQWYVIPLLGQFEVRPTVQIIFKTAVRQIVDPVASLLVTDETLVQWSWSYHLMSGSSGRRKREPLVPHELEIWEAITKAARESPLCWEAHTLSLQLQLLHANGWTVQGFCAFFV